MTTRSVVPRAERLLRRLALHDEATIRTILQHHTRETPPRETLDGKTDALIALGALLSVGAATDSCRTAVDVARAEGATDDELVDVLVAIGPAVGFARLVTAAPRLALAIGYDVQEG